MKVVTVECEAMSNVECEAVLSPVKSTSFHTLRSTQYRDCTIDIVKVLLLYFRRCYCYIVTTTLCSRNACLYDFTARYVAVHRTSNSNNGPY